MKSDARGGSVDQVHSANLSARYILGKKIIPADQLSHPEQVLPMEWSLLPRVFEVICKMFSWPHLDLFATRANAKLPLYMLPVPDPMACKQDTFQNFLDNLSACAFPPSL